MNEDNKENKSYGIYMEDSQDIKIIDSEASGFDVGIGGKNSRGIHIESTRVSSMSEEDLSKLKETILKEVEEIINEASSKKQSFRSEKFIQFISAVGSTSLVELLKSYGIFPNDK